MEENVVSAPVVSPVTKIPYWFWILFLVFGILTGLIGYLVGKKSQVVLTPPIGSFSTPSPSPIAQAESTTLEDIRKLTSEMTWSKQERSRVNYNNKEINGYQITEVKKATQKETWTKIVNYLKNEGWIDDQNNGGGAGFANISFYFKWIGDQKRVLVWSNSGGSFENPSGNVNRIFLSDVLEEKPEYPFKSEVWFNRPWPIELMNLRKDSLRDLQCESYGLGEGNTYYSTNEKHTQLNDATIQDFINNNKGIIKITKCSTSGESYIIVYETWAGGGGVGNVAHFGFLKPGFVLAPDIQIKASDGNGPYFGCPRPIALTQDLALYYLCHGGDGGYGQEAIYKIDLKNESSKLVGRCESTMKDESSEPTISCNF